MGSEVCLSICLGLGERQDSTLHGGPWETNGRKDGVRAARRLQRRKRLSSRGWDKSRCVASNGSEVS